MSFLDQTGLGTFWAKLKNYFVSKAEASAPVTGLTDILTPINIAQNSNFSRTTQTAIDATANPISSMAGNTNYYITKNIALRAVNNNRISNVSWSINNGVLTISGTCEASADPSYFWIVNHFVIPNGSYTGRYTITDASNIKVLYAKFPGTISVIDRPEIDYSTGNYKPTIIYQLTGANTYMALESYIPASETNTNFSFKVSEWILYEGEFKNPPVTTSLDVKPYSQFLHTNYDNFSYLSVGSQGTSGTAGRYRLLNLGKKSLNYKHIKFTLYKGFSTYVHFLYPVELYYISDAGNWDISQTERYRALLKCNAVGPSGNYTNRIPAFSITHDATTDNIYLNMYIAYPLGGALNLYPELSMVGGELISAWTGEVNTTDTELIKVNASLLTSL